jgi:hypothetical protein
MSATYGLVGTSPFADFGTTELEDHIYHYLGNNWSITDPPHPELTKVKIFRTATQADMTNEPGRGMHPYWIWVQHLRTTASRTDRGSSMGSTGYTAHTSTFIVHLFAYRLKSSLTFPELGLMAQEVQRILFQYPQGSQFPIPGVLHFDNWVMENVREVNNMGDAFAGVYEIICTIDAFYHKASTIPAP